MRRIGSALSPGEVGWGDAIAHSDRGTLTITEADHTLAIRNFSGRLPVRSKDTGQLLDTLLASGSFRALQTP